jgi:hypothetical protein
LAGAGSVLPRVPPRLRTPGFVEVRNGVESAEQVVVGGQERLAEGAPVQAKLVERRPAGAPQEDVGEARSER